MQKSSLPLDWIERCGQDISLKHTMIGFWRRPLTFLKAMEPTDISAIAPPTSTCNSIWKYIFHITLQSNLSFEIMWHIIILIINCLVIVGKNDSNTNTEIMQLLFVVDTYLDAPILWTLMQNLKTQNFLHRTVFAVLVMLWKCPVFKNWSDWIFFISSLFLLNCPVLGN